MYTAHEEHVFELRFLLQFAKHGLWSVYGQLGAVHNPTSQQFARLGGDARTKNIPHVRLEEE